MNSIRLAACAKLNLTLDITGRRDDGYHFLETIMQSVDLADEVTVRFSGTKSIEVYCDNPALPQNRDNLAYRAAESFFTAAGLPNPGIAIHIRKRIPSGAGLAGGSADAAAVIVGVDALMKTHMGTQRLCRMGLGIGADVPFCISGGTMLARGIGEKLTRLEPLRDCPIVIAKPEESISTARAYAAYDQTGAAVRPDTRKVIRALAEGNVKGVADGLLNVFEVVCRVPAVERIKADMLSMGAVGTCMTGSGSAVFGLFSEDKMAENCCGYLKNSVQDCVLCRPSSDGIKIL